AKRAREATVSQNDTLASTPKPIVQAAVPTAQPVLPVSALPAQTRTPELATTAPEPIFRGWRWFFLGLWLVTISPMMPWLYWLDLFIIYRLWTNGAWFRALLLIGWAFAFPLAAVILGGIH
ncbi:MAG TPA: hypothetical protein PKO06_16540, partial [Candidatus Ozemobacteraceae bacterium]|nr:hypothetical protein [Candidatus Ozemobacteraceae bacterium]